jgi:hypothetical protein
MSKEFFTIEDTIEIWLHAKSHFRTLQSLCGEDHIVKGVSVHISNAAPKTDHRAGHGQPGHMGMPRGAQGGRADKGPNSYGHSGPYGQGGGLGMAGGAGAAGWTPAGATGGRGSIEMPNIQALGLSSGGGTSGSNPMAGLNIGLPMNPALVAAALNQAAGWSIMGNLQSGGNAPTGAEHGPPFPTQTSFSTPGNVTTSQVGPGHTTMTSAAGQPASAAAAVAAVAAAGNNAGILTGWGPSTAGAPGGEAMPAQTPPAVTPQHHPGSWPSQTRDKHGNSWKYGDMP